MRYRVESRERRALAAEGSGVVVAFDYRAGAKAALPQAVREAIASLEGRS
jgi:acyl-CoA thioesterase FadM